MRITVHRDECEGNALCMGVAPDIFDVDDDGQLDVLDETPPEARRADIERAVRSCPKAALSVVD